MVVLNKIYTKTGDNGNTSLGNGDRTEKFSARVIAYGTVDELNSAVGVARLNASSKLSKNLGIIQNDLFDLGADLCKPNAKKDALESQASLRIIPNQVKRLENEIDAMNKTLSPLQSFILPGGSVSSASLHVCRTVCRRAERETVYLSKEESINPETLKYLNRLSDWFFVAARVENNKGEYDVLWDPGLSQKK